LVGEKDFTADHDVRLQDVLENDLYIEIHQEFLADAQTSIVNGKPARTVIRGPFASNKPLLPPFPQQLSC